MGRVKSGLNNVAGEAAKLGAALGVTFGAGAAINSALKFEKALTNIQSLGGRTTAEMAKLNAEILTMGKNTFLEGGPQAAAQAFYEIASGVQGADLQMAIFKASIATAEAGQADLSATTAGLVAVMNSYGFAANEASSVSDIFTRTVGLGVGSMNQFVAALAPIAGIAAQTGVSFKELGSATAYLTTKGVATSEAATQIQSTLTALLKPSDAMKEAFHKLGVSSGEALIKQYGFVGALNKLRQASGGSNEALADMFHRVEAIKGVMQLTGPEAAKFGELFTEGLSGATEAARKIQSEGPAAIFERFKNQLSALGVQIGQALLPPLTKLLGFLSKFIDALSALKLTPVIAGLLGLGAAATIAGPAVRLLGLALGVLSGPIGLVVAGLGLLGAAWEANFLGIQDMVKPVLDKVKKAFGVFKSQFGDFVGNVKRLGVRKAIESAFNLGDGKQFVSGWMQGVLEALGMTREQAAVAVTLIKNILLNAVDAFERFAAPIVGVINSVRDAIANFGSFASTDLGGVLSAMLGKPMLTNPVQGILDSIRSAIANYVPMLGDAVRGLIDGIGQFIKDNVPKVREAFESVLGSVGDWLKDGGMGKLALGLLGMIGDVATWFANDAWPELKSGVEFLWGEIKKFIESGGVRRFLDGLGTMIGQARDWFRNNAWPAIKSGVEGLFNSIRSWIVDPSAGGAATFVNGISRAVTVGLGWLTSEAGKKATENAFRAWFDNVVKPAIANLGVLVRNELQNALSNFVSRPVTTFVPGGSAFAGIYDSGTAAVNAAIAASKVSSTSIPTSLTATTRDIGAPFRPAGTRGATPFALGGFAPIGTRFKAGERGLEYGTVTPGGVQFEPMRGASVGGGGGGTRNINVYVMDRDLESRMYSILEHELA